MGNLSDYKVAHDSMLCYLKSTSYQYKFVNLGKSWIDTRFARKNHVGIYFEILPNF